MKTLIGFFVFVFALAVHANAQEPGAREGGGLPETSMSLPAEFRCNFIYDQQVGEGYFRLISSKVFKTEAGLGKFTQMDLKTMAWKAEIDSESSYKKIGNAAILDGGYFTFRVFRGSKVPSTIELFITTPIVHPADSPASLVYSSKLEYQTMTRHAGIVSGDAGFVFHQQDAESYVVGLKATCSVKTLN